MTATSRAEGDTAAGASGARGASDNDLRSEVGRFQSLGAAAASDPAVAHDLARFAAAFLAALEAGAIRAAEPDASAQGGWRVNAWVKQGILLCFRVPGLRDLARSDLRGRDRQAFGVLDLLDSTGAREAAADGAPWRVVPGGTTVRSGAHLEPGVTIMPPAYVNVGAWVGRGTMVDSHALVGSCAQVGRRVHLSAAAQVGGVLEPVGARPVVVEDDAFVAAAAAVRRRRRRKRRRPGGGRDPHRDLAPHRPRRRDRAHRVCRRAAPGPARIGRGPGIAARGR
jgi:2,3,4,5-tetrahydropyridine-2-carboxylate N-succinyltransferase